jgi:hypothetical protein
VDRHSCEDVVQEVAVRALARRVSFDSADDLIGWALTVGHNLWTDEGRRWARRGGGFAPLPDPDDNVLVGVAAGDDPALLIEDRLIADTVLAALRSMSAVDRESIVRILEDVRSHGRAETNRWGQRRSRVRRRLRAVVDGAAVGIVLVRVRLRVVASRLAEPAAGIVASAAVPALTGFLMLTPGQGHGPDPVDTSPAREGGATQVVATVDSTPTETAKSRHQLPVSHPEPSNERPDPVQPTTTDLRVPSPVDDGPLLDGEVREDDRDEPLVCVTNAPLVGSHCFVTGEGLSLP